MNNHSSTRDLTAVVRSAQPTPQMLLAYFCGHKGLRAGALFRGKLPMRCPACNVKEKP